MASFASGVESHPHLLVHTGNRTPRVAHERAEVQVDRTPRWNGADLAGGYRSIIALDEVVDPFRCLVRDGSVFAGHTL